VLKQYKKLLWFGLAVILIRLFVFGVFYVQSNSMQPTIDKGDGVLVYQLAYGLSMPWGTFVAWQWASPQRGDVVVFRNPYDDNQLWLKRVIGVPGDILSFHDHQLWLNGKPIHDFDTHVEHLPHSDGYVAYHIWSSWLEKDWQTKRIPDGYVFLMGDHRGASIDSRTWGVMAIHAIVGKVTVRFWPLNKAGDLYIVP